MTNKIHPLSDVQSTNIGKDTYVWQYSIILKNAVIGDNCNINCHCFVENDVIIGDNVTIKPCVQVWDGVRIEDNVFIGANVTFTNDIVPRSKVYPTEFKKTIIKKGASVGANSTLLAGITLGEYSLIGAGSVVTKNVPPYTVWYGNPAKHNGFVTKEGRLLDLNMYDKESNIQYRFFNDEIVI